MKVQSIKEKQSYFVFSACPQGVDGRLDNDMNEPERSENALNSLLEFGRLDTLVMT